MSLKIADNQNRDKRYYLLYASMMDMVIFGLLKFHDDEG